MSPEYCVSYLSLSTRGDVVVTSDADDLTRIAESLGRQLRIHQI
jgi:hypothetical protein